MPATQVAPVTDLSALKEALEDSGAQGKCDRCRRAPAKMRINCSLFLSGKGNGGPGKPPGKAEVKVVGYACEPCAVGIASVVARALGHLPEAPREQ